MFDWPALMDLGLRQLGLSPNRFWALTPGQLRFLTGAGPVKAPLSRDRLRALERAFPDHTPDLTETNHAR